jgi:hypothetical protein
LRPCTGCVRTRRWRTAAGILALAEIPRKRQLLVVGDILIAEQQHGMLVHAGFDVRRLLRRQRFAQVDAGDFVEERAMSTRDDAGDRTSRSGTGTHVAG